MMGGKEFAQIRHLASLPEYKRLSNALRAYRLVVSIEDANMKSMAQDYFMEHFGEGALKLVKHFNNDNPERRGILDLSGLDLSGWDLHELVVLGSILRADLSGVNLKNTNLEGVTFFQVNLEGANLEGANLSKSLLTYSDLSGANLTGANLTGAIGRDVVLKNTNFTNAILFDISIDATEEDLDGIILKGAKYDDETFLVGYDPFRGGQITIADSIVRDPKYGAIKVDNSTSDDNR